MYTLIFSFPIEILYFFGLLSVVWLAFIFLKRPIYEAMFSGYIVIIILTGRYDLFFINLLKPSTNIVFYAIIAFLVLAQIFNETRVVDKVKDIILSLAGRFRGGAGHVSLIASVFMASLSGTGPGNAAATGVFTIPAMIKTKFPRSLAASTEMAVSSLGPMLPPSGTILLSFSILNTFLPADKEISLSIFWIAVWGVGIWYILQRFIVLLGFCYYYDVKPLYSKKLPNFYQALKAGWRSLIIPLLILVPLLIDAKFPELIISRVGREGSEAFSNSILLFTPGVVLIYSLWIGKEEIEGGISFKIIFNLFKKMLPKITPVAATAYFAYAIAYVCQDIQMGNSIVEWVSGFSCPGIMIIIFVAVFPVVLGMVLPGSSQVAIFGATFIQLLTTAGINPLLAGALLPALTGPMGNMTPPLALAMYVAMGIAGADYWETAKLAYIWIAFHVLTTILILIGFLPSFVLQ